MNRKKDIEKLNINQEDMFEVPANFFDELEKDILKKTIDKEVYEEPSENVKPLYRKTWFWSAAASLVIGLVFLTKMNFSNQKDEVDYLAGISQEEIMAYMEENDLTNEIYAYADYYDVEPDLSSELEVSSEQLLDEIDIDDIDFDDIDI